MIYHCSSRARRAALTDEAFWVDVADSILGPSDIDDIDDIDVATLTGDPCPVCGEYGACMADAEGRLLVHVIDPEA